MLTRRFKKAVCAFSENCGGDGRAAEDGPGTATSISIFSPMRVKGTGVNLLSAKHSKSESDSDPESWSLCRFIKSRSLRLPSHPVRFR